MRQKHMWHRQIKAWANGYSIEVACGPVGKYGRGWIPTNNPAWDTSGDYTYRVVDNCEGEDKCSESQLNLFPGE